MRIAASLNFSLKHTHTHTSWGHIHAAFRLSLLWHNNVTVDLWGPALYSFSFWSLIDNPFQSLSPDCASPSSPCLRYVCPFHCSMFTVMSSFFVFTGIWCFNLMLSFCFQLPQLVWLLLTLLCVCFCIVWVLRLIQFIFFVLVLWFVYLFLTIAYLCCELHPFGGQKVGYKSRINICKGGLATKCCWIRLQGLDCSIQYLTNNPTFLSLVLSFKSFHFSCVSVRF